MTKRTKYNLQVRYLTDLSLLIDSPKLTKKALTDLTLELTNLLTSKGIDLVMVERKTLERSLASRKVTSE